MKNDNWVKSDSGIIILKPEPIAKQASIEVVRELTPEMLKQLEDQARKKAA
jgi:hypothetical protein